MSHYDNTKEDSRQWRTYQDTAAQAADTAAQAGATALGNSTAARARQNGILVTPATSSGAAASTVQLTATPISIGSGTVTWTTSDATKATVNSSGLVTRVATGTATITATAPSSKDASSAPISGSSLITIT